PADTTAPEISTTTVTGDQLVLTYTEANSLNGAALTGNAGFTVSSTDDAAITVSSAVVNGAAKTVTLTLSRAVVHREMLRVSYTKPTSGHGVRDAAGNDAANFSDRAVTNNTRDTTAPQLLAPTHDHDRPELTDDTHLSLRFSDTSLLDENHNNRPANRDFTVLVDGVANTVTDVAVNGMSLTLTLTTPVIGGQRVTVAYQDSTLDDTKGIRDTEGNSLASIPTTVVVNNLLDMVSPQLITVGDARPKVNGNQLVLSFSDTNNLDADPTHKPANEAFTVLVNGVANAVTEVTVNAQTKTVTLTLTTAVTHGQPVTVAYADPSPDSNDANAIQDASGNDAPSFAATAVTNNTPAPTDTTPRVSNSELTVGIAIADSALTAGETTTVTFTFTEPVNGFDTRDITCTNGTLSQPAANAERTVWTATFTPTASINAPSNVFNVDLTGVTDNAGNAGESEITSANYSVDTRDTVAPLLHSATVNGTQLVLSFNDTGNLDADPTHTPANGAFTVLVDGVANAVTSVTVEPQAKTVTLTLSTAVTSGQSVTVAYADPTTGNDANAIQDTAGNDAASFAATAVTNNTPAPADTTAPALIITGDSRPKVTGDQLVLSFSDTGNLDADAGHTPAPGAFTVLVNGVANAVTNVTVEPQAKTVTLTLTTAVTSGQSVTVAYADPTAGNDANAIQDAAGNDAASFAATAVTNNTPVPADTTAPALIITGDSRPKVTGDQLVLSFNDTSNLDGAALTGSAGFTVSDAAGAAITVSGAMVNATAKTVTLTLGRAAAPGETVHVSYAKPAASNGVQDAAGNAAVNFSNEAVTNNTPADTTPPVINTTTVNGDQLVLTYTETYSLDGATLTGNAGFTVASLTVDTGATTIPVNSAVVNGAAKTVTLTLSRAVVYGELVRVSYAKPATSNGVQDAAGNAAASFSDRDVVNDTPDTAAPQLITTGDERPTITDGIYLGLHFSDASSSLDDSNGPAKEDFTVLVNGAANTVAAVTTEGMYKIVLLTLSTPVQSGQRVTVSYQDSTPGNDNGIQDPTGNRLLSIPTTVVMNDTVAPQLITTDGARPKVNGNQLVLSFTDTSDLDADVAHKPANGAFTVLVNGVANAVTNVTVEPQAKTVTLTLSTAVTSGQTVTVAYADPTTDNDANAMQDAAGNDAASFAATAVTNNTPAPADTTPPQLIITGDSRPKVTGNQLVLSFDDTSNLDADAGHTPAPGAFTVLVNSVANAVTNVTVDSQAKTVTLTLTTAVTSDQSVTVAYADPTTGNDANAIQDAAGNDAPSFAATAVTNNTADTTPPQLITTGDTTRPKVTGNQLVLSFDDTGNLDANAGHTPAPGAFTVLVNSVANAVTNVTVDSQAKTVTLTLTTAVTSGQTVTVAYADPTTDNDANAIQDAAGNDAASFAATAVTNNTPAPADTTPPQLIITGDSRPKVTGNQLVLSFDDTSNLDADAGHTPAPGAFTVLVNSVANAVTNVTVDSQAKTVTLTLTTAVTSDQSVTIAYADPTTGNDANAIQDAAGNDAPSFAATAVTNNTPAPADTAAPALIITGDSRPKVTGDQLVLSFSDTGNLDADAAHKPASGTFTVLVNGVANAVTNVAIEPQAKTVTLTLTTAVTSDQTVTVAYADPTTGNDANAIQDATGNDTASFAATAVTNNTPAPADTTAPALIITGDSRPKVTGDQLVLSFSDTGNLDADTTHTPANGAFTVLVDSVANAVTNVAINAEAKTVTLTLTTAVTSDQTVTVAYADPTTGNDANAIQDAAGNDAASFAATAVTNNTPAPADTTAPALIITGDARPKVNNNQLVLSYTEANSLNGAALTGSAGFTVSSDAGTAITVSSAVVSATAKTVTLTLSRAVANGETVHVSYAKPAASNGVQDAAGNAAVDFSNQAVTNDTPDTTPPAINSAAVNGNHLVLTYTEANSLDGAALMGNAGFTVSGAAGAAITVSSAVVNATDKTVTLTLSRAVISSEIVRVSYAKPAASNGVRDVAGNAAVDFIDRPVTNTTPAADTTPPGLNTATVNGNQLVLTYAEANTLDEAALTG
ncbi:hypothetical protein D8B24_20555, partial [Verminephrobacter aporrectodeae subsp. tuberculatae]|uniref:SwmB domain-containing protein n=2 Tax=Verminephrobacter aporrectodeae TaxID=1110389 RepID=UPI0022444879